MLIWTVSFTSTRYETSGFVYKVNAFTGTDTSRLLHDITVLKMKFLAAIAVAAGFLAVAQGICLPGYSAVGDKCYVVPGLPSYFSWWSASEICSFAYGDLFHVSTIDEWNQLNDFLIGLDYTDTYWTGVSAEGHPGTWVVRSTGQELKLDAVDFKEGAPSNSADKLCLVVEYQAELGKYQWVDRACSDEVLIVCEPKRCFGQ